MLRHRHDAGAPGARSKVSTRGGALRLGRGTASLAVVASLLAATVPVLAVLAGTAPALAGPPAFSWSRFALPQNGWTATGAIDAITCLPSSRLCLALDSTGGILVADERAIGRGAGAAAWSRADIDESDQLDALSCTAGGFCAAADFDGGVLTATDPAGGAAAWARAQVDGTNAIDGISCASRTLCVAVDGAGNVLWSSSPAGGAGAWQVAHVDGSTQIDAVSCPAAGFCVAVDSAGGVLWSTNPTGGAGAWHMAGVDGPAVLNAVSCPTIALCVAADGAGSVLWSADPAGGAGAWHAALIASSDIQVLACPVTTFCVAGDDAGNLYWSTDPSGGTGAWSGAAVTGAANATAAACGGPNLCLLGNQFGDVLASAAPAGGAATWIVAPVDGVLPVSALACPSPSACVSGTQSGRFFSSTDPNGGPTKWSMEAGGAPAAIGAISCPAAARCIAADAAGGLLWSTDPIAGSSAVWQRANVDAGVPIGALACPSTGLCVAGDDAGNILWSTNPSGGTASWSPATISPGASLHALACPSVSFCVAAGDDGTAFTSTNPTGGRLAWSGARIDGTTAIVALACPSAGLCVAADAVGNLLWSTNPTGGAASWSSATISPGVGLRALSCPTPAFCAAADATGGVFLSIDPVGGAGAWTPTTLTGSPGLGALACPSVSFCVGGDTAGDVVTGAPESATAPAPYHPLAPVRVCDTRTGPGIPANQCSGKTLAGGTPLDIKLVGATPVPAGATAVVLNVTVTDTTAGTWLTVWPGGTTAPPTSSLDWVRGEAIANLVTVALGPAGDVQAELPPQGGAADLVVDLEGYDAPGTPGSTAGLYNSLVPYRICDTRSFAANATPCAGRTLGPGATLHVQVTGTGGAAGVPSAGVAAVTVNVTAIGPTAPSGGYLTVYPTNALGSAPLASNLDFAAGETVANRVTVPVGTGGAISVYNATGDTDVAIDVNGWFADGSAADPGGLDFSATSPLRICDTRVALLVAPDPCSGAPPGAGTILDVHAAGVEGIPTTARALVANVTAAGAVAPGYLTLWPGGVSTPPVVSDCNWAPGEAIANEVVVRLGPAGDVQAASPQAQVDVVVDVEGWYA